MVMIVDSLILQMIVFLPVMLLIVYISTLLPFLLRSLARYVAGQYLLSIYCFLTFLSLTEIVWRYTFVFDLRYLVFLRLDYMFH